MGITAVDKPNKEITVDGGVVTTDATHSVVRASTWGKTVTPLDKIIDDTADIYGLGRNEELVGKAIKDRRDQVVLATKFGNVRTPEGVFVGVNGKPDYVRSACEASARAMCCRTAIRRAG